MRMKAASRDLLDAFEVGCAVLPLAVGTKNGHIADGGTFLRHRLLEWTLIDPNVGILR
jgi:hypothetical protein